MATEGIPISRLPRESSSSGVDVPGVKSGRTVKISLDLLATKNEVQNIDNNRKGYFSTDTELKTAYPIPKVGWVAYVGSTGTIWKVSGNTWVNSGDPIPSDVDLSQLAEVNKKLYSYKEIDITSIDELDDIRRAYGIYGITLPDVDANFGQRFTFCHYPNNSDAGYAYQKVLTHNVKDNGYYPSRCFERVGWIASSGAPGSWTPWVCKEDNYDRKAYTSYKGLLSFSSQEEYIVKCIKYIKVWVSSPYINNDIVLSVVGVATTGNVMFQIYDKTTSKVLGSFVQEIEGQPSGIIRYKKTNIGVSDIDCALDIVFDWSIYTNRMQSTSSTIKVECDVYGGDSYINEFELSDRLKNISRQIEYIKNIAITNKCTDVNGAIKDSESSYHIPIGYAGNGSVIYFSDNANKYQYPVGYIIGGTVKISFINKTVSELQHEDILIQKVTGTSYINTKLGATKSIEESDNIVFVTFQFSYIITQKDIDEGYGFQFFYQNSFISTSIVSSEVYVSVISQNIGYGLYINEKVKELDEKVSQITITEYKTIKVDRWDNSADFYGNDAIQQAIDSITDASPSKIYTLLVNGVFEAKQTSDYHQSGRNAFIRTKNYVNIKGSGRNTCIILASLPDNLGSSFAYSSYEGITFQSISELSGMTVIGRNIRYPIHIDGGATGCKDYLLKYTDSKVWHQGNTGDAINWLSWHPLGVGMSDGQTIICENCEIAGKAHAFYSHSNADYENASSFIYRNCTFIANGEAAYSGGINVLGSVQPMGTGKSDKMIFMDCKWENKGIINYNDSPYISKTTTNQKADHAEYELFLNINPQPFNNSGLRGFGLKIVSKSIGSSSSVRFDETSSAFPLIVGKTNESNEFINRYGFNQKNGYQYRDGGNGLSGWACGLWDIGENAVGNPANTYMNSLGKRLGDCSSANKTLVVIIDGTSYNIVFNKNYNGTDSLTPSNYTNTQIIDEMLLVIGSVATIEQYPVGRDYYPSFDDVLFLKNADTVEVIKGMGVVFTNNNSFRLAENSDGKIDGICIDDGRVGDFCRIIKSGSLYSSYTGQRFSIKETSSASRMIGIKAGISTTQKGVFDVNATPKLLEVTSIADVFEII